jgi:F-type H+-transporting ATPase subunit delta
MKSRQERAPPPRRHGLFNVECLRRFPSHTLAALLAERLVAAPKIACYQAPVFGRGGFFGFLRPGDFFGAIKPLCRNGTPCPGVRRDGGIQAVQVADDSQASDVAARYARALFDLAVESDALNAIEADLKSLKSMIEASADLRGVLVSPRHTAEDKARSLAAIAERAALTGTTQKFLGLLAANRRTGVLPAIIAAFDRLVAARRGRVSAVVTTAVSLSPAQSDSLAAALRSALGKDPQIESRVDPAILGGVKVRVGSRLYDASLKSKLDSLKFALKRA